MDQVKKWAAENAEGVERADAAILMLSETGDLPRFERMCRDAFTAERGIGCGFAARLAQTLALG